MATTKKNVATKVAEEAKVVTPNVMVTVFLNSPMGIEFDPIINGKRVKVVLKGNAENLRGANQGKLPTVKSPAASANQVDSAVWEEVKKQFGSMALFTSGIVQEAYTPEEEAMAKGRALHARNKLEPYEG